MHIELTFMVGAAFQYFEGAAAAFALVAKHFAAGPKHDIGVALLVAPPRFKPAADPHGVVCRKAVRFLPAGFLNEERQHSAAAAPMQAFGYGSTLGWQCFQPGCFAAARAQGDGQ